MRVLLVEDNKDTLATVAAVLRFEKYEVITAEHARIALELAEVYPPEVVLLDIGLPGMDGYALAQALRKQTPRPYIVAVTAYSSPEDKAKANAAGIDAHLAKPASPSVILEILESVHQRQPGFATNTLTR